MDPQLLLEVLRAGVKEFMTQPLRPDEVQQAFQRFRERHSEASPRRLRAAAGKVISVIGGSPVSRTLVATSLAAALKGGGAGRRGRRHEPAAAAATSSAYFASWPIRARAPRRSTSTLSRLDHAFLSDIMDQTRLGGGMLIPLGDSGPVRRQVKLRMRGPHAEDDANDLRTYVVTDAGHNIRHGDLLASASPATGRLCLSRALTVRGRPPHQAPGSDALAPARSRRGSTPT